VRINSNENLKALLVKGNRVSQQMRLLLWIQIISLLCSQVRLDFHLNLFSHLLYYYFIYIIYIYIHIDII